MVILLWSYGAQYAAGRLLSAVSAILVIQTLDNIAVCNDRRWKAMTGVFQGMTESSRVILLGPRHIWVLYTKSV
jgi:hypothetical protein